MILVAVSSSANAEESGLLEKYIANEPTLVFGPNTRMNIGNNQIVNIFGVDKCPSDFHDQITGMQPQEGCIIVNKNKINVIYLVDGKKKTEQWTVKKSGTRTRLIRPNGLLVSQEN